MEKRDSCYDGDGPKKGQVRECYAGRYTRKLSSGRKQPFRVRSQIWQDSCVKVESICLWEEGL